MGTRMKNKHVEVQFIADQDVGKQIISIKDIKNKKIGNAVQRRKTRKHCKSSDSDEELDDVPYKELDTNEKPTALFQDGDIPGQQMFGFQTPKGKRAAMPKTPRATKTPQSRKAIETPHASSNQVSSAKTPYSLRRRLKKKIASTAWHAADGHLSDSDFSASDSEYIPSDSDTSLPSEDESRDDDDEAVEEPKHRPRREQRLREMEYVLEAAEFFTNQKSVTSDHTLNRLQQPRLAEKQLHELLEDMTLSHKQAVYNLCEDHTQLFSKWMFALREQYSVVLYGLGSKRHTLQQFRTQMLKDHLVLEVNGFFPSLTMKEVVDSIADEVLELPDRPAGMLECLEVIEEELSSELFIIVHNLDGPMLQSNKSQDVLSRLAKMEHVHLVASIDHINAPLIWDQAKLSRYNFVWWDVTSLQPYSGETQFESSLLVQRSGGLALSSLSNVFNSLTTNARKIFIIMVRHQLRNHKDPTFLGMWIAIGSSWMELSVLAFWS
ncbi:Origin recognition complex subunit 2 [Zootermopsis nevadensis]|uniref:Origin recognition complex subunit 2 n=1 Tax=Zootermopsis nevadensis TaxID=136037 RepID=A0A067RAK7_ZOONE|nr:Origin recognition complex subunit 2 [Zootermopsis nevadensis]